MSKSNLKNINKLRVTKLPYIVYSNSTYSNLLHKLQKSILWGITTHVWLNFSLDDLNHDNSALITIGIRYTWRNYRMFKNTVTKYNPTQINSNKGLLELSNKVRYRYIDVDMVAYIEKLMLQERRRLQKIKVYKRIYKIT